MTVQNNYNPFKTKVAGSAYTPTIPGLDKKVQGSSFVGRSIFNSLNYFNNQDNSSDMTGLQVETNNNNANAQTGAQTASTVQNTGGGAGGRASAARAQAAKATEDGNKDISDSQGNTQELGVQKDASQQSTDQTEGETAGSCDAEKQYTQDIKQCKMQSKKFGQQIKKDTDAKYKLEVKLAELTGQKAPSKPSDAGAKDAAKGAVAPAKSGNADGTNSANGNGDAAGNTASAANAGSTGSTDAAANAAAGNQPDRTFSLTTGAEQDRIDGKTQPQSNQQGGIITGRQNSQPTTPANAQIAQNNQINPQNPQQGPQQVRNNDQGHQDNHRKNVDARKDNPFANHHNQTNPGNESKKGEIARLIREIKSKGQSIKTKTQQRTRVDKKSQNDHQQGISRNSAQCKNLDAAKQKSSGVQKFAQGMQKVAQTANSIANAVRMTGIAVIMTGHAIAAIPFCQALGEAVARVGEAVKYVGDIACKVTKVFMVAAGAVTAAATGNLTCLAVAAGSMAMSYATMDNAYNGQGSDAAANGATGAATDAASNSAEDVAVTGVKGSLSDMASGASESSGNALTRFADEVSNGYKEVEEKITAPFQKVYDGLDSSTGGALRAGVASYKAYNAINGAIDSVNGGGNAQGGNGGAQDGNAAAQGGNGAGGADSSNNRQQASAASKSNNSGSQNANRDKEVNEWVEKIKNGQSTLDEIDDEDLRDQVKDKLKQVAPWLLENNDAGNSYGQQSNVA